MLWMRNVHMRVSCGATRMQRHSRDSAGMLQQRASLCRRAMAASLLRMESCCARTSPRSCACRATMDSTLRPSSSSAWALLFLSASSSAADLLSCCASSLWKLRTKCSRWWQRRLSY